MKTLFRLLFVLALTLQTTGVALAHGAGPLGEGIVVGPDGEADADDDPKASDCGASPANPTDPVDLETGEFFLPAHLLTTPDLKIRGRGLDIDLARSYRSQWEYNGVLGYGWDFRFNRRLRQLADGSVVVTTGTCRSVTYQPEPGVLPPQYQTPPRVFSELTYDASTFGHIETMPDGRAYSFDANGNLSAISDRHGNQITFSYSTTKKPIHGAAKYFVDEVQRIVAYEYQLETITDPAGRVVTLNYYDAGDGKIGRLHTVTDWTERVWTYDYDAWGNLSKVTSPPFGTPPTSGTTEYVYGRPQGEDPHDLTDIVTPRYFAAGGGGTPVVQNVYDDQGRVQDQYYGDGGHIQLDYSYDVSGATNTIVTQDNADGGNPTVKTYQYNADGSLQWSSVAVRGDLRPSNQEPVLPGGGNATEFKTSYLYDVNGNYDRITYPDGSFTQFVYDSANVDPKARANLLSVIRNPPPGSGVAKISVGYTYKQPYNLLETITDPRGEVTTLHYVANSSGLLDDIQFPLVDGSSPVVDYTMNTYGLVTAIQDPDGNRMNFEYDSATNESYVSAVIFEQGDPEERRIEFAPDSLGRPTKLHRAVGSATDESLHQLEFNELDLIERITGPGSTPAVTEYRYWEDGLLREVLRATPEGPGNEQNTLFTYTIRGDLESVSNELNETTSYGYDWSRNRNLVDEPIASGEQPRQTSIQYDERDLVYTVTDAENRVSTFHYTLNGNLREVIDGEQQRTVYKPDEFGRLERVTYEDLTYEEWSYDAASNVTQFVTRLGDSISFEVYDALNRLRQRTDSSGTTTFGYYPSGRMSSATNADASVVLVFNDFGELQSESLTYAGTGLPAYVVQYGYDKRGNVERVTYPDSTTYFTYERDGEDRLRFIRDNAQAARVERRWNELSELTDALYSSGMTLTPDFDAASRLTQLTYDDGVADLLSLVYGIHPTGRVDSVTQDGLLHDYDYDRTDQLTGVTYAPGVNLPSTTYQYDDAGNREQEVIAGQTIAYMPDTAGLNQYQSVDGVAFAYDLNGNLTDDGANTYTFDPESRLTGASGPNSSGGTFTATYAYDAFRRRVWKEVDGTRTYFVWGGDRLLEERDPSGDVAVQYVYGDGYAPELVGYVNGLGSTDWYEVVNDRLDTPRMLINAGGTVVWRADFEPFGAGTPDDDPDENSVSLAFNIRFPGQYFDEETGLHYNRFRYYDPGIGRYVSTEPVGQFGILERAGVLPLLGRGARTAGFTGGNLYSYALNSPLRYVDPDGRKLFFAGGRGALIVGGGGEASAGFYVGTHEGANSDQGFFGTSFDAGFYGNVGVGVGFEASASVEVGAADSLSGLAGNLNAGVGPVEGSLILDPSPCNLEGSDGSYGDFVNALVTGGSLGLGVGVPFGLSGTATASGTTTDLGRAIGRALGSLF